MEFRMVLCASLGATVLGIASPSSALETGQCKPAAEVRSAIAAEGQNPVVIGNQSGYGRPYALIFTSNKDGSKGYALRGDKPFGELATTICIDSIFHDVRLNDFTVAGIPPWAQFDADPSLVEVACKRERLGYQEICRPYPASAISQDSNGQRVALVAIGTAINPRDKTMRDDQRIVLTLHAAEQVGMLNAVTREGASYMLSGYSKGAFTQHSAGILTKR